MHLPEEETLLKEELLKNLTQVALCDIEPFHHKDFSYFIQACFSKAPLHYMKTSLFDAYHLLTLWRFYQTVISDPKIHFEHHTARVDEKTNTDASLSTMTLTMVNHDRPFIVGSLLSLLKKWGVKPCYLVHPILTVKRDNQGRFISFEPRGTLGENIRVESFIYCPIEGDASLFAHLQRDLPLILKDVKSATQDWPDLLKQVDKVCDHIQDNQHTQLGGNWLELDLFLTWLKQDHFTFLGYAYFSLYDDDHKIRRSPETHGALGLLRNSEHCHIDKIFEGIVYRHSTRRLLYGSAPLLINKTTLISRVHRSTPMDAIGIKAFDKQGRVTGVHLFLGLFTSFAYDSSAKDIPYLRRKIDTILSAADLSPEWHDGKNLIHILDSLPRDELLQTSVDDLKKISLDILDLQDNPRLALFIRTDIFNRYLSCLVYMPHDQFNSKIVDSMGEVLAENLGGTISLVKSHIGLKLFTRIHYTLTLKDPPLTYSLKHIEQKLIALAKSWTDHLNECLKENLDTWHSTKLYTKYKMAFGKFYQERYSCMQVLEDILKCEQVFQTNHYTVHMTGGEAPQTLSFKVYHPEKPMILSDIMPTLENLGFKILSEIPFKIKVDTAPYIIWMHHFELECNHEEAMEHKEALLDTIIRIRDKHIEDDAFNKLVLQATLTSRQVEVIRAYGKYLRQLDIPFGQSTLQAALMNNPTLTRHIVQLFEKKMDPAQPILDQDLLHAITKELDAVQSPDDDRILRRYLNLVHATLRTNYYQKADNHTYKSYLSFKLDGRVLEDIPLPKPLYEIFVYSPQMEAVHLRGGKVARGGIRWSDRFEDFRTEILGLLKAQMVKNAVIVPVGSKGGFVVKTLLSTMTREESQAEGIKAYETMIQGMLDITDNLVDGKIVPAFTARWDEDDPYLVVAADKGTATFSDYANALSIKNHFWLDDAFASGGSNGYDHKKMGITARGAWESVKRHFYEMTINPAIDDITVVGVGDMSGDVFGNGLLQSQSLKLLCAFDHRHIFIDPDPDCQQSYEERLRLFKLPRSTWNDYNRNTLSQGGGVYDRTQKIIPLTLEVKKLINTDKTHLTPNELIQSFLKMPVDLLWFGGIGTFIKASSQSHQDVGDRSNDSVRVNGRDVKAQVIAEGANLGVTHLGRIEYAAKGRVNTDAIDNSAGVDCSDHEVNIKILLNAALVKGTLTRTERNELLASMTDEVGRLVLKDNYLQNHCISLMQALGPSSLDGHIRLIRDLEKRGRLNRFLEFLPDDVTLMDMQTAQVGLSRPELSVVMAYGKNFLFEELLKGSFIDDPHLNHVLLNYFPVDLQKTFMEEIIHHPLRREIIATSLANQIINRMGASYIHDMMERTGKPIDVIVKAYWIVTLVLRMPQVWAELETYDHQMENTCQLRIYLDLMRLVRRASLWVIRKISLESPLEILLERLDGGVLFYLRDLELFLDDDFRDLFNSTRQGYKDLGASEGFALRLATLRMASESPDILLISEKTHMAVPDVARLYFSMTSRFHFSFIKTQLEQLHAPTPWIRQIISGLIEDIYAIQFRCVMSVISFLRRENYSLTQDNFDKWLRAHEPLMNRYDTLMQDIKATGMYDVMVFIPFIREIRLLFETQS